MFDPHTELLEFLQRNGLGPQVVDSLGKTEWLEDWVRQYLAYASQALIDDGGLDAEAARRLRAMLDAKPNQKSWSTTKIREEIG